jgi:hypothetical protein
MQRLRRLARMMGASEDYADLLARTYWTEIYPLNTSDTGPRLVATEARSTSTRAATFGRRRVSLRSGSSTGSRARSPAR